MKEMLQRSLAKNIGSTVILILTWLKKPAKALFDFKIQLKKLVPRNLMLNQSIFLSKKINARSKRVNFKVKRSGFLSYIEFASKQVLIKFAVFLAQVFEYQQSGQ